MKKHLFLTTTALLAITPAIVVSAETELELESTSTTTAEQPVIASIYIDEFAGADWLHPLDKRTTFASRTVNYNVSSIQELKNAFYAGLSNYSDSITITSNGSMTGKMMSEEFNKYWGNMLDVDDYLARQVKSFQQTTQGNKLTINIIYYADYEEQQYISTSVKEIAADIIDPSMNDFQKVKAVNDYIALNTVYNKLTQGSPYSVYTLLTEGEAVCQAYALLALRLFQEAGLQAHYVRGDAAGGPHAWNLVRVDGQWYHIDTTWNDPTIQTNNKVDTRNVDYKYFLLSDAQITRDHALNLPSGTLPKATSTKYSALHSIRKPLQIDDYLFYSNKADSDTLYSVDLSASTPTAQKLSSTRYSLMFYANGGIYFSNYSHSGYLFKLDLEEMEEMLLVSERVGHIAQQGDYLVAYNLDGEAIYTEEIYESNDDYVEDDYEEEEEYPTLDDDEVEEIIDLIDALDPDEATFLQDYIYIKSLVEEANAADIANILNYDTLEYYYDTAIEYATLVDTINERIYSLNVGMDPIKLLESIEEISNLLDEVPAAVIANIDGTEMLNFLEQYLEELNEFEDWSSEELVNAMVEIADNIEIMHPDFFTNANQLYKMVISLDEESYSLFSEEQSQTIEYIIELLEKMRSLNFEESAEIQDVPKTRDVNKTWTLYMSYDLLDTAANRNRVSVLDMFGDPVDVTVTFDENAILIEPDDSYAKGVQYTVVLESGLASANGKVLKTDHHMHFTVQ